MTYRAEIDGLRAIAVVPVILFHAGFEAFDGGYVGVDVFFVISGYLITSIIIAEMSAGKFSLRDFYERRARRILPALLFVVLCCLPVAWIVLLPRDFEDFAQSLVAVATFSSNVLFWQTSGYFDTATDLKPLLHTWSLAVEEQYYILFPLLLMALWRFGIRVVVATLAVLFAASLTLAQAGAVTNPSATFYLLPTRIWELLIGGFAAFYLQHRAITTPPALNNALSATGLAMIFCAVFVYDAATPFPSLYALVPTLGTVLVVLFGLPGTLAHRVLTRRGIVLIGLMSYSAYLWHQPVLAFARHWFVVDLTPGQIAAALALTAVLSYCSWRYVEQPFRNRQRIPRQWIFGFSVTGLALTAGIGLAGHLGQGFMFRYPGAERIYAAASGWYDADACAFAGPTRATDRIGACAGTDTVYLLGDSHAGAISQELRAELARHGLTLLTWTRRGCLPVPGTTRLPAAAHRDCARYVDNALAFVRDNPAPLVLAARWRLAMEGTRFDNGEGGVEHGDPARTYVTGERSADLADHIAAQLTALAREVPLIVVDQIPEAGWDVPRLALRRFPGGDAAADISTSYDVYRDANAAVTALFERLESHATVVRTAPMVCSDRTQRCLNTEDGLPLYTDDDHPSRIFSTRIADAIADRVVAQIARDGGTPE